MAKFFTRRAVRYACRTAALLILLMILFLPGGSPAEIVIPQNVSIIEEQAFAGIHTDRVVLPQGLTTIEREAFADSVIGSVSLPDSITFIAPNAFRGAQISSLELPGKLVQGSALQQWASHNAADYACLPPVDLSGLPESIPAGIDLDFSFQMVEGADWYEIKGKNAAGRDLMLFVGEDWENRVCRTSVQGFNIQPGNLHLEVTAFQYVDDASINYEITRTTIVDLPATGSVPSAPDITVTGIDFGIASLGHPYTVTVSWEGDITEISDYRAEFTGYGGNEQENTRAISNGQSSYQSIVDYSQDHVGINTYRYAVKANGVWSPVSETVVYVMDRSNESEHPEHIADAPSISLPAEIRTGQDLALRFSPVDGAVDYRILIEYGSDQEITPESEKIAYEDNSRSFTLDGYQLEAGPVRVTVTAKGKDGGELSSSGSCVVTDSRPPAPAVTASVQNPPVNSPYSVTVDTRGADALVMLFGSENWEYYEEISVQGDETVIDGFTDDKPDQYYYGASVRINGLWSEWGETVVVTGP